MKTIKVDLKNNPYNIYIGKNALKELNSLIASKINPSKIAIITNSTIANLYLNNITDAISNNWKKEILILPDGEIYKSLKQTEEIYTWLIENKFDRDCLILAFGGGVVGDLAGFIAATFLRGVKLIQVPTTLLAQVDSSIGGKVGVNHSLGKNLIGDFYQPQFVLADISLLQSLNYEEYICGLGEVVKYALIKDKILFKFLKENINILKSDNFVINEKLVSISAKHKADIVAKDEKEIGIRAILNFGHTFGHALEKLYDYKNLKHGQAVLLGMKCAVLASQILNYISELNAKEIIELINQFKINLPQKITSTDIIDLIRFMEYDKKVKNEKINFILINDIGKVFKSEINNQDIIHNVFKQLN